MELLPRTQASAARASAAGGSSLGAAHSPHPSQEIDTPVSIYISIYLSLNLSRGVGRGGGYGGCSPPPLEKRGKGKEKKGGKKRRSEMEAKHSEWKDKPVISIA